MKRKIYYMNGYAWILPAIFFVLAAGMTVFVVIIPLNLTINNLTDLLLLGACFLLALGIGWYPALIFYESPKTRLELSDEGVFFLGGGYRLYTPWQNISAVRWLWFSTETPGFLFLKEPASMGDFSFDEGVASRRAVFEKRCWWLSRLDIRAAQYRSIIRIPVAFLKKQDKQEGLIRQYLQMYVPQLIDPQTPREVYRGDMKAVFKMMYPTVISVPMILLAFQIESTLGITWWYTYFSFLAIWLLFENRKIILLLVSRVVRKDQ